jgi:hypothetical protein
VPCRGRRSERDEGEMSCDKAVSTADFADRADGKASWRDDVHRTVRVRVFVGPPLVGVPSRLSGSLRAGPATSAGPTARNLRTSANEWESHVPKHLRHPRNPRSTSSGKNP